MPRTKQETFDIIKLYYSLCDLDAEQAQNRILEWFSTRNIRKGLTVNTIPRAKRSITLEAFSKFYNELAADGHSITYESIRRWKKQYDKVAKSGKIEQVIEKSSTTAGGKRVYSKAFKIQILKEYKERVNYHAKQTVAGFAKEKQIPYNTVEKWIYNSELRKQMYSYAVPESL